MILFLVFQGQLLPPCYGETNWDWSYRRHSISPPTGLHPSGTRPFGFRGAFNQKPICQILIYTYFFASRPLNCFALHPLLLFRRVVQPRFLPNSSYGWMYTLLKCTCNSFLASSHPQPLTSTIPRTHGSKEVCFQFPSSRLSKFKRYKQEQRNNVRM